MIGGFIVFVMLFTIGTGFFVFVNQENGAYDQSLAERAAAMQGQISESLQVSGSAGENNNLTLTFTNIGSVSSNITDALVVDPGKVLHTYGLGFTSNTTPALPAGVNVETTTRSFDTDLKIVPGTYAIKVLTQRGNAFVTTFPQPQVTSISTSLSSFVVTAGGSVSDTATLAGVTSSAGGTVTYSYFSGSSCKGSATVVSTVTVTNSVVPASSAATFSVVGSYSWDAVYSGDPNNGAATSPCEPLVVTAAPDCVPSPSNICQSTASQGLGSIAIDWNSFRYYSYSGCSSGTGGSIDAGSLSPPTNSCALSPDKVTLAPLAYTVSSGSWESSGGVNHVFSLNVTNADPQKRSMVLDGWTQLWFSAFNLGAGGGRSHSEAYGLVLVTNVNGNPTVPITTLTSTPQITIAYGQTATLFFAINNGGDPDNYGGGNVTPIFMLFHGTLGGQQWAENFPLTSTFWLA